MTIDTELAYAEDILDAPNDERTLVAMLLTYTGRDIAPAHLASIEPEDFNDAHLGEIWAAARAISQRGGRLSKRTILAERDTPAIRARIDRLAGEPFHIKNVAVAARSVTDMAQSRRLIQACKRIAETTTTAESYSDALEFAAQQLAQLEGGHIQTDVQSFDKVTERWLEWLHAPKEANRTISTPWPELDDVLAGGLHAQRTYVIGGRPGDGKSLAGINLAMHAAMMGNRTAVFSVEMGTNEVASRIFAAGAQVEYSQITRRELDPYNREKVDGFVTRYRDMPLFIVDKSDITVDYVSARCRAIKRNGGLDVVFVDYLQLLKETDSRQARERQVAHISRSLKVMSRELDCAVIIACQLNRKGGDNDRKPVLSDLRESGSIEQDADIVILLHHQFENDQPTGFVDLIVAKNRTGKCLSVAQRWMGYQARIA